MSGENTTEIVQHLLAELTGEANVEPTVRRLIDRGVARLHGLCFTLLQRDYPRLMRPPLNLQSEELLSAVVERLLKALREARPRTVREFFSLAGQHMRWELNDLARRLDNQPPIAQLPNEDPSTPSLSESRLSANSLQILTVIDGLPNDEREAFDLVRIQGLTYAEAAEVLGVASKTVQRRLDRGLRLLTERLAHLNPNAEV